MSIDLFALAWKVNFPGKPIKKLVLLSLADQANDRDHHCWPTYETIATRCGMSRRTAIATVAELEHDGFIRRIARYKAGGLHTSNAFWVNRATMEAAIAANGEVASPQPAPMVIEVHHNGEPAAPSMVIHVHPNGDPRAPRTPIDPSSEPKEEPPTASATPAAADPPAAAADPLQPILDWLDFDDALTPKERQALTVADLLAWAYWAKLKQAESHGRITNPIGWVRSQWRNGRPPRADLLRLARGWLALDDDGRARLLGRIEWAADYGTTHGDAFEDEFPDIPPVAAAAVYTATGGELGPPSLMPAQAIAPAGAPPPKPAGRPIAAPSTNEATNETQTTGSTLWRDTLAELEMQMTRATYSQWLAGTTATLAGNELTIQVRNHNAIAWLSNRLHDLITRTVTALAGRPLTIHYQVSQ